MRTRWAGGIAAATASLLVLGALPAGAEDGFDSGQWWMDAMRVDEAHEQVTGEGVTIALLDGPVYQDAPELQGQDVIPSGSRCLQYDLTPSPAAGPASHHTKHTTAMAALLVGNGRGNRPDGRGTSGVAPGATLRTYVVFDHDRDNGETGDPKLECQHFERPPDEFLREVLADEPDIVVSTTTWGGVSQEVIDEGIEDGVVFVSSAGNEGPEAPVVPMGQLHGVAVVAAGDRDGGYANFNSGPAPLYYLDENDQLTTDPEKAVMLVPDQGGAGRITILAAGVEITTGGYFDGRWESDAYSSGTSGAGVVVAGALALAMERWPEATGNQVLQSMVRNANGTFPAGYDRYYGFGGLSLPSLLEEDPGQYPDVHPFYGGLRWALEPDPPPPIMHTVGEDGSLGPWQPVYTQDELDLPYPRGPLSPPEREASASPDRPDAPSASAENDGPGAAADTSGAAPGGGPPWPWVAGGAGLVALIAGAGLWGRRRQRDDTGAGPAFAVEGERA